MKPKSLLVALFVSLAFNLFLVGAVAGGLVIGHRFRGAEHARTERPPPPLWRAAEGLAPEQATAYRQQVDEAGHDLREAMRAARVARRQAWEGLSSQPFDPVAAKARLAAVRQQEIDARGRIEDRIVDYAATLPPADREILTRGLTVNERHDRDRSRSERESRKD